MTNEEIIRLLEMLLKKETSGHLCEVYKKSIVALKKIGLLNDALDCFDNAEEAQGYSSYGVTNFARDVARVLRSDDL